MFAAVDYRGCLNDSALLLKLKRGPWHSRRRRARGGAAPSSAAAGRTTAAEGRQLAWPECPLHGDGDGDVGRRRGR